MSTSGGYHQFQVGERAQVTTVAGLRRGFVHELLPNDRIRVLLDVGWAREVHNDEAFYVHPEDLRIDMGMASRLRLDLRHRVGNHNTNIARINTALVGTGVAKVFILMKDRSSVDINTLSEYKEFLQAHGLNDDISSLQI